MTYTKRENAYNTDTCYKIGKGLGRQQECITNLLTLHRAVRFSSYRSTPAIHEHGKTRVFSVDTVTHDISRTCNTHHHFGVNYARVLMACDRLWRPRRTNRKLRSLAEITEHTIPLLRLLLLYVSSQIFPKCGRFVIGMHESWPNVGSCDITLIQNLRCLSIIVLSDAWYNYILPKIISFAERK